MLEELFGLIAREDAVEVERHAEFVRIGFVGGAGWEDEAGGHTRVQRPAHIGFVCAQKEGGVEGFHIGVRVFSAQESAARNVQPVVFARGEETESGLRVVAGKDDYFHGFFVREGLVQV